MIEINRKIKLNYLFYYELIYKYNFNALQLVQILKY